MFCHCLTRLKAIEYTLQLKESCRFLFGFLFAPYLVMYFQEIQDFEGLLLGGKQVQKEQNLFGPITTTTLRSAKF